MVKLFLALFVFIAINSNAQIDSAKIYFMPLKMESKIRVPYDQVTSQVESYVTSDSILCIQLYSFLRDSLPCTCVKKGKWNDFRAVIEFYSSGAKAAYYISNSGWEIIKPDGRTYSNGDVSKFRFLNRFILEHFKPVTASQKIWFKVLRASN